MNPSNTLLSRIRNFAIIAHIDHGKSTLSDKIIIACGGLEAREMKDQVLDSLKVERDRGITVKAQIISLSYKYDGEIYILNLIDTPGHVDFSYEVKRSLGACEGAIVLVDAAQGVQAQTLANVRTAKDNKLYLLPVLNKIDLPSAQPEYVAQQIKDILNIEDEPVKVSSKTGFGVLDLLEAIITRIPCPSGEMQDALQALIVDSWFDQHIGIVILARIMSGSVKAKMMIKFLNTQKEYRVISVGVFTPKKKELPELGTGMSGYIIANVREIADCLPGDTIAESGKECSKLPGFIPMKPFVFCGIYPTTKEEYGTLKKSLEKLQLNDGSLTIQTTHIPAFGNGFNCGFLGLLHLEVIQQRLVEEFNIEIITTAPGVIYKAHTKTGKVLNIEHPSNLPDPSSIEYISEPWAKVSIFIESSHIGQIIELCKLKRGVEDYSINDNYMERLADDRYILRYLIPLSEIIYEFHDQLKAATQGYGSFEYEVDEYKTADIVPLTILVQGSPVEALSSMVHKERSLSYGRWICEELQKSIDRALVPIAIQAAIGGKIIARETVPALRKDVLAKCYGGDISRKKKLLEKQKEGKERMKELSLAMGVQIPLAKIRKILVGKGNA